MRNLILLCVACTLTVALNGQSINDSFFTKVSYIGAFNEDVDWTSGWAEWDPVNKEYPDPAETKGNGVFTEPGGIKISSDETWSGNLKLDGWVYVEDGATLTISPGTIIRGTERSALIIKKGAKINAIGTSEAPIVFTSDQGAGFRGSSNWGGIVICGKGIVNTAGGEKITEGGVGVYYGGTDNNDNSGIMKYVRIEFPGYEVATGSELNGLSLCGVGAGTTLEYIQVSYSGDDGFEWWGGAVNAKYLIAYKTEDDDFDTDNGYSGMVQFGLILRDAEIVDTDTANGFESDNDDGGNDVQPYTHAIFSNISAFGPSITSTDPATLQKNHNEGSAMRIRRASRLRVYNSVFAGWGRGLRIESSLSWTAAQADMLTVQNSIIAGVRNDWFRTDVSGVSADDIRNWFLDSSRKNDTILLAADLKITHPFSFTGPDFRPQNDSPVLNASNWYFLTGNNEFTSINNQSEWRAYPNPFTGITYIHLQIEETSEVKAEVYDINGKLVKVLYKGVMTPGTGSLEFNASDLPKGFYIGRITAENNTYFVRMISK